MEKLHSIALRREEKMGFSLSPSPRNGDGLISGNSACPIPKLKYVAGTETDIPQAMGYYQKVGKKKLQRNAGTSSPRQV